MFRKIPPRKVSDEVFAQVHQLIKCGRLKPGDRLPPERELALQLAVSRSSVREAILRLQCLGLLEQRQGDGTYVRAATDAPLQDAFIEFLKGGSGLLDLLEVRRVLETWAAATAAERGSDDELGRIRRFGAEMGAGDKDPEEGFGANVTFHRLIALATHNVLLVHLMDTMASWIRQITREMDASPYEDRSLRQRLHQQHQAIAAAIWARDPEAAAAAMAAHLEFTAAQVERLQRDRGHGNGSCRQARG